MTPEELAEQFAELNGHLTECLGSPEPGRHLVGLACQVLDGCRWAAMTCWPRGSQPFTIAASAQVPRRADQIQYDAAEGPCLTATEESVVAWSADLAAETRWPRFTARALADTPVRGVASYPLRVGRDDGPYALNVYADRAGAFGQQTVAAGILFASHACVLMQHAAVAEHTGQLQQALASSRQIGAAIGVIMATYRLPEEAAFAVLQRTSNQLNRKLRDVAQHVTGTGRLPTG